MAAAGRRLRGHALHDLLGRGVDAHPKFPALVSKVGHSLVGVAILGQSGLHVFDKWFVLMGVFAGGGGGGQGECGQGLGTIVPIACTGEACFFGGWFAPCLLCGLS